MWALTPRPIREIPAPLAFSRISLRLYLTYSLALTGNNVKIKILAYVKRKCKIRSEIVGAGPPRPDFCGIGEPNPYEDSVSVAHFLNMSEPFSPFSTNPLR